MARPAQHSKITLCLVPVAGAFLALQGTLYWLQEILACWLFFSVVFGLVTIAVLAGVAICSAIVNLFRWMVGTARTAPHVPLTNPTLHPK